MAIFRAAREPSLPGKVVLLTVSVISAFLTSGIIYGYSGLYKVLAVDEHAFISTCAAGESPPCEGQSNSLTLAYTAGAATISASAIVIGAFLDKVGPRWTVTAGAVLFAVGLLCMALASRVADSLYFVAFFFLSLGGPCTFNSMMNFAELFPSASAAIIAAQNGMFDASSVVMFGMGKVVEMAGIPLTQVMAVYLIVPLLLFIVGIALFPDQPFGLDGASGNKGELWRVYKLKYKHLHPEGGAEEPLLEGGEEGEVREPDDVYNSDIRTQLRSPIFWTVTVVSGYLILRSNFYIASVYSQMHFITRTQPVNGAMLSPEAAVDLAQGYVDVFNYALPIGGLVMVPVAGYIMVRLGMVSSFICIGVMCMAYTGINALYWIPLNYQMLSFLCYALVRPFIFGATAAFLGRVFGFGNFGRLYGINRMAGAILTLLQYPLASLAEGYFEGNYFWINIGFLVIELIMTVTFPIYLWKCVFYGFFFRPEELLAPENLPSEGLLPPFSEVVVVSGSEVQPNDQYHDASDETDAIDVSYEGGAVDPPVVKSNAPEDPPKEKSSLKPIVGGMWNYMLGVTTTST